MKKLSALKKLKRLLLQSARNRKKRRRIAKRYSLGEIAATGGRFKARREALELFCARRRLCTRSIIQKRPAEKRIALICPPRLNIHSDFEQTVSFFLDLQHFIHLRRNTKRVTKYVEFSDLETIDIGSLLVLAAELDMSMGRQSNKRFRKRMLPADIHLWKPGIAYLFQKFGILKLVGYRPREEEGGLAEHPDLIPISFRRDSYVKGRLANDLIQEIAILTAHKDEAQRGKVYTALTEAMTNTNMHAYPPEFANYPGRTEKCWWGGAIYDRASQTARFVMYDRGIGLPKTIPKRHWARSVIDSGANSDSALIEAALEAPRSSTGEPQHGLGLRQMADAVDHRSGSFLRIISGKGVVNYRGNNNITSSELPIDFGGTLIEWSICDQE